MTPDDLREERLARLIAATRAGANPAVLARARARIAANERVPGVAAWLGRPTVLAGAGVLFALCIAGTFVVSQRVTASASEASLISSLVGEEDLGLPIETSDAGATSGGAAGDSGGVNP